MTHPSPYKAKKAAVCSSEIAAAVFRVDLINKKLENKGTTWREDEFARGITFGGEEHPLVHTLPSAQDSRPSAALLTLGFSGQRGNRVRPCFWRDTKTAVMEQRKVQNEIWYCQKTSLRASYSIAGENTWIVFVSLWLQENYRCGGHTRYPPSRDVTTSHGCAEYPWNTVSALHFPFFRKCFTRCQDCKRQKRGVYPIPALHLTNSTKFTLPQLHKIRSVLISRV